MKLVMAIVNDEDAFHVMDALNERGYFVTKIATTGGFLRSGNTTLICGIEDDKLDDLVSVMEKKCKARKQVTAINASHISDTESYIPYPVEVNVGGATIFVMNIEKFIKV